VLVFGLFTNLLFTKMLKVSVGRKRPDFISRCNVNWTLVESSCDLRMGDGWVDNCFNCRCNILSAKRIKLQLEPVNVNTLIDRDPPSVAPPSKGPTHEGPGSSERPNETSHHKMTNSDLFQRLDTDGDGMISRDDVATFLTHQLGEQRSQVLKIYVENFIRNADKDEDGRVSHGELDEWLIKTQSLLRRLFDELREDEEEITLNGFRNAMKQKAHLMLSLSEARAILEKLDKNRDGTVSFDELSDSLLFVYHDENSEMTELMEFFEINETVAPADDAGMSSRLESFVAGGVAGSISRTITAPLERIRVIMNTQTTKNPQFKRDFLKAVQAVNAESGLPGFWRGNFVNICRIAPSSATTFGVFDVAKTFFSKLEGKETRDLSHLSRFLSGGIAGFTASTVTYPIELVQIRVMTQGLKMDPDAVSTDSAHIGQKRCYSTKAQSAPSKSVIVNTVKGLYNDSLGIRSFYKGWVPSSLGIIGYSGLNLSTFETLKHTYLKYNDVSHVPSSVVMVIGMISTCIAATSVYPLSCVRTRLQAQGSPAHPFVYSGMRDCMRKTLKREGVKGFYRGLPASLSKAVPGASLSFTLVEKIRHLLKESRS
jgi:solute carrier family 25 phosphate transporter 23/24/25/41